MKLGLKSVIGDYSVLFRRKSEFLYKSLTSMDCFAIRKNKLLQIVKKYTVFGHALKQKVLERYVSCVRKPVQDHKKETLAQLKRVKKYD